MQAATDLSAAVGVSAACDALGIARSAFYRQRPRPLGVQGPAAPTRQPPARALRPDERETVLTTLHAERFRDRAPAAVQATLLDEGTYLCSTRTMYRVLADAGESRERRDQLVHPAYQKPQLLATAPNQLWSWDITKLLGPAKWTYFYLYVILDVFSRYVVGWMIAHREGAELAEAFIAETDFPHISPSISGGEVDGAHAEQGNDLLLQQIELGLEGLDALLAGPEVVTLQGGEELEDPFGTRCAALPLLRVEGQVVDAGGGHALPE